MPFQMIKIQMDGSVFMCSSGQPAHLNAFQVDPLEIWNSEAFKKLRQQLDTGEYDEMCLQCPLVQDFKQADAETDPVRIEALNYRLGDEAVLTGERQPLPPGSIAGWVDVFEQSPNMLSVSGWAVDLEAKRPAKVVVVFLDDAAKGAGRPMRPRTDVTMLFKLPEATKCGYHIIVPLQDKRLPEAVRVRVFAVNEAGGACELQYAPKHAQLGRPAAVGEPPAQPRTPWHRLPRRAAGSLNRRLQGWMHSLGG
jgi:hypothetical protein